MARKRKKKSAEQPADQNELPFLESEEDADQERRRVVDVKSATAAYQTSSEQLQAGTDSADSPEEELITIENERDQYLALAKRTQAEFENYRKRREREMEQIKRASLQDFLKDFFDAFDDLDRALTEGDNEHSYESFHDGVKLVRENLWKVMEKAGVSPIQAEGMKFDPNLHEAMTAVPSPDHEPNTIIKVFKPGYMLDDVVLRHAKVIVSAAGS